MPIRVFLRRASQRRRTRLRPNPTEEKDLLDEEQFSATAYFDTTRFRPPYICTAAFQNDLQEARSLQSLGGRKLDINETTWVKTEDITKSTLLTCCLSIRMGLLQYISRQR